MSTKYYDKLLSKVMTDLLDLNQIEYAPFDQVSGDRKKLVAVKKDSEWLSFYSKLYVQYISSFKNLESVYDQITHIQKREVIKTMLDSTMTRLLEIRKDLIMYNTKTKALNSDFINMDELLFEGKILPDALEVPIPKYMREADDEVLNQRDDLVSKYLAREGRELGEEEVTVIRNPVEMNRDSAIHMILVNERGRQGILKGQRNREAYEQKAKRKKKGGDQGVDKATESYLVFQKYFRAYLDRMEVEKMRNEEMQFLGMKPSQMQIDDLKFLTPKERENFDIDKKIEDIKDKRRAVQSRNKEELKNLKVKVKTEIETHDVPDMREKQLYDMRKWITEYYEQHEGKELPEKVEDFYTKDDKALPLTKEEIEAKKKADAEKAKAAKKAEEDKKKKKKTEAQAFMDEREGRGPANSQALRDLIERIDKFNNEWMSTDESVGVDQRPNKEFIINDLKPSIQTKVVLAKTGE